MLLIVGFHTYAYTFSLQLFTHDFMNHLTSHIYNNSIAIYQCVSIHCRKGSDWSNEIQNRRDALRRKEMGIIERHDEVSPPHRLLLT